MLMFKDHTGAEHDFDSLPEVSRRGIIGRGIAHVLGNEVASQVVGKVRKTIADGAGVKADSVTTEQVKTFRAAHAADIQTWTLAFQNDKLQAIKEGTLGERTGGTAVDPLSREMNSIARKEVKAFFKAQGWAFPTGDKVFTSGSGDAAKTFTGDELVDLWLSKEENAARIEKEANAELRRKANEAKKVAAAASGASLAEALGL